MILPDVNILVHAFRTDASEHPLCGPWLASVVAGDAAFGISRLALSTVVRITTNPRVYRVPSSFQDVFGFCEDLLRQPHVQLVEPGERHWDVFQRLCIETNTRGTDVTDAWFAALAIEAGCEWITLDRGFARFPGLRWRAPTSQAPAGRS